MNTSGAISQADRDPLILVFRLLQTSATILLVALVGATAFFLGMRLVYADKALPGVQAAGLNLEGMTEAQIRTALAQTLSYPEDGLIVFQEGDQTWVAHPKDVGVSIDINAMTHQALSTGRMGTFGQQLDDQLRTWQEGFMVPTLLVFDQGQAVTFLEGLAAQIDLPLLEATLTLEGIQVEVRRGQIGRRLIIPETLQLLSSPVALMHDATIALVVEETPPLVLDASAQAELAAQILSQALTLTAEDVGPWAFEPPALAAMLRINLVSDEQGSQYQVGLAREPMLAFLSSLAPDFTREPVNARFIFNDDTRQLDLLEPAVIGRSLDVTATFESINQALVEGQHQVPLVFEVIEPDVKDEATAADLGITEAVSVESTYFNGSSPERIHNIRTASAVFHGLLVAPGETLSMAENLGDISLDTGYAEALIIFGDRTINGVGGGVCQVSTTLFRAAFFGGYQIDERHPHAYRVSYYEQGRNSPGPGLDATVFVPIVDFRFTNDTSNWLLIENYIYGNQLLWKFYSSSDGRQVQWDSSGPMNVIEAPEPLYTENPDLAPGEIEQVDWEADGMDLIVTRRVERNGVVLHADTFKTHYLPWRAIYEYGPGTELPEDAQVGETP